LLSDLRADMSYNEFDVALRKAIDQIYSASSS